jgi:hypothetical protein
LDTALGRGLRKECQSELAYPAGAEGAMVPSANRKNAQHVQRHGWLGHTSPDDGKASDVNQQETDAAGIGDVIGVSFACRSCCIPSLT